MPKPDSPQPAKRLSRLRPFLWRWHKRVGVVAAAVVVMVAITGLLLNHTSELELGKQSVRWDWMLSHYGYQRPQLTSYQVDGHWVSGDGSGTVYLDTGSVAQCRDDLVGAVRTERLLVVACRSELLLLDHAGGVIEKLGRTYGMPTPIDQLGLCQGEVCLAISGRVIQADFDRLLWTPVDHAVVWSQPGLLPKDIRRPLVDDQLKTLLSWERVMLDLHSGRIVGSVGVWLVDLCALLLLFLSLSGFVLWYQRRGR